MLNHLVVFIGNYAVDNAEKKWINDTNLAKKWLKNENGEYDYINSTNNNMKCVAYMLDTDLWNTLYKDTQGFAEYVIGGPTLKMFAESYNLTHASAIGYQKEGGTTDDGYNVKLGSGNYSTYCVGLLKENTNPLNGLYVITNDNNAVGMWLASPSADSKSNMLAVDCDGRLSNDHLNDVLGFRPVVCLSSNISLEQVGEGANITFNLK